jgi:hypothetical protein
MKELFSSILEGFSIAYLRIVRHQLVQFAPWFTGVDRLGKGDQKILPNRKKQSVFGEFVSSDQKI